MAEEGGQGWLWKEGPAQAGQGSVPGSRPCGLLTSFLAVQMALCGLECGVQCAAASVLVDLGHDELWS